MMISWGGVTDQAAYPSFRRVARSVVGYLNVWFGGSELKDLSAQISYIPIVMNEEARARHPARSRLSRTERVYYCCPQLDHEVFVSGSHNRQLEEYVQGLKECVARLLDLGASPTQVAAFRRALQDTRLDLAERRLH